MPPVSEKQRKAMGAALAAKRRGHVKPGTSSAKIAGSMTTSQIKDFAAKPGMVKSRGKKGK